MISQLILIWLHHPLSALSVENLKRESGQSLVEYALLMVLVGLIVVGMLVLLGPAVRNMFAEIVSSMSNASP